MRRAPALFLTVMLLGLAALSMTGPTAAQQAVRGGTLTFATGADPDSLDPQNTQSNPGEQVNRMMHENLVRFSSSMQLEPALA
jgi:ABC-type transport system substrate-binding protein